MKMIGNNALVDSSILIDLMKGDKVVAKKLDSLSEIYLSPIVISEIYFGAHRSGNPIKQLTKIAIAIQRFKILSIDAATAQHFVAIKLDLFAKGNPIPENDIWIAASAIQHQLTVYTTDAHFKSVTGLDLI